MNLPDTILLHILYLSLVFCQGPPLPASNQVCLIVPPDVEQCYRNFQGKPIDDKAAQVNCLQKLLWNFTPDTNNTQAELDYFRSLAGNIGAYTASSILRDGPPRPPSGRRARQEYRTLTQEERIRFHDALNKLYEDGTIRAFARLYAQAFGSHHNGASFLPWLRVFLVMFEEALRRIDPKVALPFWDSTMDNDMDNPVNSGLWTPEYFGNGIGDVTSGPAAGWVTDRGNLERNYGQASRLFSKDQIRSILSKCELQQISHPTAEIGYDFELYSNGAHIWVGGDMASPATSGYDPVFYMHHAFADYIWELFRRRQYRRCSIDPTQDYPNVPAGNSHAPESPMTGFEWLTVADGLKDYWLDNWYYYESTPACPNCCRGCQFPAPIYCHRRRRICIARSRRTFAFGPRTSNISPAKAFAQASLEPAEIEALSVPSPPLNRGISYQHPPNDGRTIHTAISDAFTAADRERIAAQQAPGQPSDRAIADRRGSRRNRSGRTSRRTIPEGWGPPPVRRTADMTTLSDGRSTLEEGRVFSNSRFPPSDRGTSNGAVSHIDRRTGSPGRSLSPDRRILPDPRGSTPARRTSVESVGSQTQRRTFSGGRRRSQDRRLSPDSQISRVSESDTLIRGRGQMLGRLASFADTRDLRQSSGVSSNTDRSQASTRRLASRILPTGRRLSPPVNLISPESRAFSTGGQTPILDMRSIKVAVPSPRNRGPVFDVPL
ncbi:tyrosinase-like protein 2 [Mercenaria mercenaria]|uniref:tyrosinase-like protein 2 n=1 Tax=Mercenaria mercenaria TaxID=6596 RepID=UPI00234F191B|nr:tyrosinase-like protein 2 [Mercenaria mercenaria]